MLTAPWQDGHLGRVRISRAAASSTASWTALSSFSGSRSSGTVCRRTSGARGGQRRLKGRKLEEAQAKGPGRSQARSARALPPSGGSSGPRKPRSTRQASAGRAVSFATGFAIAPEALHSFGCRLPLPPSLLLAPLLPPLLPPAATRCRHSLPPPAAATRCRHPLPPPAAATRCRHPLPPPAATRCRHPLPLAAATRCHPLPPPAAATRCRHPLPLAADTRCRHPLPPASDSSHASSPDELSPALRLWPQPTQS